MEFPYCNKKCLPAKNCEWFVWVKQKYGKACTRKMKGGGGYVCAPVIKLQMYSVGQYLEKHLDTKKSNLSGLHMNLEMNAKKDRKSVV